MLFMAAVDPLFVKIYMIFAKTMLCSLSNDGHIKGNAEGDAEMAPEGRPRHPRGTVPDSFPATGVLPLLGSEVTARENSKDLQIARGRLPNDVKIAEKLSHPVRPFRVFIQ